LLNHPLIFTPLYQSRPWGGRAIASSFARAMPGGTIGESWEIVDRPTEQSVVARGPLAGRTLRALLDEDAAAIMGPAWDSSRPFPILVKWLDCRERLSLQVHPPASVAAALSGEPKTECWFIARAEPHAALMAGLRRGVTRQDFERGITTSTLEPLVHRMPVAAGDSLFVPSGRVHAIDAGNLILEIQQNSDTTYRVYDWGRVDSQGASRALHVAESMECIDFADFEPDPTRASDAQDVVLAECSEFRIQRSRRAAGEMFAPPSGPPQARILSVVSGDVVVEDRGFRLQPEVYVAGDNVLLPAAMSTGIRAASESVVLITDRFSQV
jgi:mannose-6-phosphate isomerase